MEHPERQPASGGRPLLCPGPHLACQGCAGRALVPGDVLHVDDRGQAGCLPGSHACRHCRGRGFFCARTPACRGAHFADTPAFGPFAFPPV
ncbi:hypothetical protein RKE29_12475 [Streptomyces sp. B1866]|uniref:hypothetical protein n=1 Tax=Streptomyces sp. B1866 TaxID=3075431 RepID=UPI00288C9565|nr:hypothetical protein [Streptomyces sp. B1866]MDT3397454.1 hypothetical protein [Streptomyces sp. B1866]